MKNINKLGTLLLFSIFITACNSEPSLEEYMADSWQTSYIKIEMPTFQKQDTTSVYEDSFDNNPPRIAQSKYNSDGTFVAWYLTPTGVRLGDTPGTWRVEGDSLFIEYEYGAGTRKVPYHIKRTEEGFVGTSKYDWDEDGEFDDLLIMKTKRIVLEEKENQ